MESIDSKDKSQIIYAKISGNIELNFSRRFWDLVDEIF